MGWWYKYIEYDIVPISEKNLMLDIFDKIKLSLGCSKRILTPNKQITFGKILSIYPSLNNISETKISTRAKFSLFLEKLVLFFCE